ncbi:DUF421 domain-containing protein [Deinococcus rubellus]|uniref:DUF421 domain-containing protein n=1 Tax=Deinococcus rubellus TaxID=1889240 RepID=A0ABY5YG40_9DEIO|nr:DUF421 domain-containing protein [Deinococcus rubellus]UWX64022.1 DUF421 domain-containing protein [Deinococcus rubellus]
MHRTHMSMQSLKPQLRHQGVTDVGKVQFAILKSGGTISVVSDNSGARGSTLPRRMDEPDLKSAT